MQAHVTPTGKSVLDELGLDAGYIVKAKLAVRIQKSIAEMGLTQREAAARMPISQPKLSLLTRGKLNDISQSKLEDCLRALGHDVDGSLKPHKIAEAFDYILVIRTVTKFLLSLFVRIGREYMFNDILRIQVMRECGATLLTISRDIDILGDFRE